jgi:hypothetical protein
LFVNPAQFAFVAFGWQWRGICCLQCLFPWLHLEMSEMGMLWLLGASQQNFPKKTREHT